MIAAVCAIYSAGAHGGVTTPAAVLAVYRREGGAKVILYMDASLARTAEERR